jgi:hypothetical protein
MLSVFRQRYSGSYLILGPGCIATRCMHFDWLHVIPRICGSYFSFRAYHNPSVPVPDRRVPPVRRTANSLNKRCHLRRTGQIYRVQAGTDLFRVVVDDGEAVRLGQRMEGRES